MELIFAIGIGILGIWLFVSDAHDSERKKFSKRNRKFQKNDTVDLNSVTVPVNAVQEIEMMAKNKRRQSKRKGKF